MPDLNCHDLEAAMRIRRRHGSQHGRAGRVNRPRQFLPNHALARVEPAAAADRDSAKGTRGNRNSMGGCGLVPGRLNQEIYGNKRGKKYARRCEDSRNALPHRRGDSLSPGQQDVEVRRDRRASHEPRRRSQARRPDGARHDRAAARAGQGEKGAGDRRRREGSARRKRPAPTTSAAKRWSRRSRRKTGSTSMPSSRRPT